MTRAVSRRNPARRALKSPQRLPNSPQKLGKLPKSDHFRACADEIVQKDIVYIRTIAGFEPFRTCRPSPIWFAGAVALESGVAFGQQSDGPRFADAPCAMTGLCFPPASDQNPVTHLDRLKTGETP
ncbi:hypothetical protein [Bosea sp. ANAM02]|uniref:hypothetical protein n=1 Tax=Bosea sp. ANAM02 TaxID=2020412 RepID=UPI0015663141|nr:hypothetical protein [Bosea sp. ANAM02]